MSIDDPLLLSADKQSPSVPQNASAWGSTIPVSFGRRIVQGKIIWFQQTSNDPAKLVANMAVAFGFSGMPSEQRANTSLLRVWADKTLIYDVTDPTATAETFPGMGVTFHPGLAEAQPDETIRADKGDSTPAFRDLIYAVFKSFPMWKTELKASQAPVFRAEISDAQAVVNAETAFSLTGTQPETYGFMFDKERGSLYTWSKDGGSTVVTLQEHSVADRSQTADMPVSPAPSSGLGLIVDRVMVHDRHNGLVWSESDRNANYSPHVCVRLDSGQLVVEKGIANATFVSNDTTIPNSNAGDVVKCRAYGADFYGVMFGSFVSRVFSLFQYTHTPYDVGGMVGQSDVGGEVQGGDIDIEWVGRVDHGGGISFEVGAIAAYPLVGRADLDDRFHLGQTQRQDWFAYACEHSSEVILFSGGQYGDRMTLGASSVAYNFPGFTVRNVAVDPVDYNLLVFMEDGSNNEFLAKLEVDVALSTDGTGLKPTVARLKYHVTLDDFHLSRNSIREGRFSGGLFAYTSASADKVYLVDLSNGQVVNSAAVAPGVEAGVDKDLFWDGLTNSFVVAGATSPGSGLTAVDILVDNDAGSVTLETLLTWLAMRAGYDEADVEVTGVDDTVIGAIVTHQTDVWRICGDLGAVFDFSFFDSEDKIKFVRAARGQDAVLAFELGDNDLAPLDDNGERPNVKTTIGSPTEVVASVQVEYIDPDLDYTEAAQTFRRPQFPFKTQHSTKVTTYSVPVVMSGSDVMSRAAKIAYQNYGAGISQEFRLPFKFAQLEPKDLVRVDAGDRSYIVEVTETVFNADWSISVSGLDANYNNGVTLSVDTPEGFVPKSVRLPSNSRALLLDVPLLVTDDEPPTPGSVLYLAAESYGQSGWEYADVQDDQGSGFATEFRTADDVGYGTCTSTLADVAIPHAIYEDTLTVVGTSIGSLVSITEDQLLAGENSALVGAPGRWELIFFRDVVQTGRQLSLTGLVRGRRGTEVNCGLHGTADQFVLVSSAGLREDIRPVEADAAVGDTVRARAVGANVPNNPPAVGLAFNANSARPFAPCSVLAAPGSSNSVDITWTRRTRLEGPWDNGTGTVPLDEASEAYELEIMSGPGGTVVRTVTGISSPAYNYTSADQTTDGFTPRVATVTVRVYQVSALVGRGFTKETTVNVE